MNETYGIWCVVSGAAGHREAWLKKIDGRRAEFGSLVEASEEAKRLSREMNHTRSVARFHYRPEPIN